MAARKQKQSSPFIHPQDLIAFKPGGGRRFYYHPPPPDSDPTASPPLTGGGAWPTVGNQAPKADPPQPSPAPSPAPQTDPPERPAEGSRLGKAFKDARERGRRAAFGELNEQAKKLGFTSYEEMMQAAAESRRPKPPARAQTASPSSDQPPEPPRNKTDRKAWDRYLREKTAWDKERDAKANEIKKANRKIKALEQQQRQIETRNRLEKVAMSAGIREVDFAVELIEREFAQKPGEDDDSYEKRLSETDERKFFEGLRGPRPYLFGEVVLPANTGHPASPSAAAPRPGEATRRELDVGKFDAKKASREEYEQYLRSKGLRIPSS